MFCQIFREHVLPMIPIGSGYSDPSINWMLFALSIFSLACSTMDQEGKKTRVRSAEAMARRKMKRRLKPKYVF